jgi:hypothetical protein
MNQSTFSRIRRLFDPELPVLGPGQPLDPQVVDTLYGLLQVLADDTELPRADFERAVQRRAIRERAQHDEYVAGAALLDALARRSLGAAFAERSVEERERIVARLMAGHPSPDVQSRLLRRLRLTSYNLHVVFGRPARKRFRKFVAGDLLSYYYTTARGWAVVGYREFPGFVQTESEPCEVLRVRTEGADVVLELSDACHERLRPETLGVDAQGRFVCKTKWGRQSAVFSRDAQLALGALLEESPDGASVRVTGSTHDLVLGDVAR